MTKRTLKLGDLIEELFALQGMMKSVTIDRENRLVNVKKHWRAIIDVLNKKEELLEKAITGERIGS